MQIVWDPVKKKWINSDGGEDETNGDLKPPPKLADLMPSPTQLPQTPVDVMPQISYTSPSPMIMNSNNASNGVKDDAMKAENKTPSLQSNMYKMQRNRSK